MSGIKNVWGGGALFVKDKDLGNVEALKEAFTVLEQNDVHTIDTAALYGDSEAILGEAGALSRFTVDTKLKGGFAGPGGAAPDKIKAEVANSQKLLGGNVDVLYIHAPDDKTPLEDTLAAVAEAHKSGFFKRFGLSNFHAEDVQRVYDICKDKGYPLPQVYQGNYSAVARKQETLLFPTLRKLDIAFYAYSPLAGGFLTKTKQQLEEGHGRFQRGTMLGDMYYNMYHKPSYLEALGEWEKIAEEEGVSKVALAYRWVKYHSPLKRENGDAIIVGARTLEQLKDTLKGLNAGPLSDRAVKRIEDIWPTIEKDAPLDNMHQNS